MLFIILPAYNEEKALPGVLADIELNCFGLPHKVIVVDDASTDHTFSFVKHYKLEHPNVELIRHEENKGLGGALMSGFQKVSNVQEQNSECMPDIVVTMDADNTHPADRIRLLCHEIKSGADLVIASRYVQGGTQYGLSVLRRILSWGAGNVMKMFFPIEGVRDYSCGYRAYRLSIIKEAMQVYGDTLLESRNFSAMVELLLKVTPFCRKVCEIPLHLHYERKQGASKMHIWATILGYMALIYRFRHDNKRNMEWIEEH